MHSFLIVFLAIIAYLATEFFTKKLWLRVVIVMLIMIIQPIITSNQENFQKNKLENEVKLSMLEEFADNVKVICVWRTCLNNYWTPQVQIAEMMNKYELVNLLRDEVLRKDVKETYRLLRDGEGMIHKFRDGAGYKNREELGTMKKHIDTCLKQLKNSILVLDKDLYGEKIGTVEAKKINYNPSDDFVIHNYMSTGTASGSIVEATPLIGK